MFHRFARWTLVFGNILASSRLRRLLNSPSIWQVAIASPLRRQFDYLAAANSLATPGCRVQVPFGPRQVTGLITAVKTTTDIPASQLKTATKVIDEHPLFNTTQLTWLQWAATYYQHPIGDALFAALPKFLREGKAASLRLDTVWRALDGDINLIKRAQRQQALWQHLQQQGPCSNTELQKAGFTSQLAQALAAKQLAQQIVKTESPSDLTASSRSTSQPLQLNDEQQRAVRQTLAQLDQFCPLLLEGVTGSGKTEVYLQIIANVIQRQQQALVLVPEIGLTPQTVQRFQQRFPDQHIACLHSGMNDTERHNAWLQAQQGQAKIVIGTRSSALVPLANPGLIIIDEEHDASFKQQEGFRYSARDLALVRAQYEQIPVLLGSATPSLGSLNNALTERYQHLRLQHRAGNAKPPRIDILDVRATPMHDGLSAPLLNAARQRLQQGQQVMLFLNRRGYAPTLMCHTCGWSADCHDCDSHMTLHQQPAHLHCHHCDRSLPIPNTCPACHSEQLITLGAGTEKTEETLRQMFPDVPVIRIDRDSTQNKGAMQRLLAPVNAGEPCLLIGTQMLAKGHHFPNVTLVAILDGDSGLCSPDYRGPEKLGQLTIQVAGRAGRGDLNGQVLIQSHRSEHPYLQQLAQGDYHPFARGLLQQRQQALLPPYSHQALVRADSKHLDLLENCLQQLQQQLNPHLQEGDQLLGPLPSPLSRRAGRYRYYLQIQSNRRGQLHQHLHRAVHLLEALPGRKIRWSIDVDPVEL